MLAVSAMAACGERETPAETPTEQKPAGVPAKPLAYMLQATYPHDTTLFTEGFFVHEGVLYESTGSPENLPQLRSMIGISDLRTGKFQKKVELDSKKYFGEGICMLNGKIFQLTYVSQTGFVYDAKTWKCLDTFRFENAEGWGLTTDGKEIIMTDGTNEITFLDPQTLKPLRKLAVTDGGVALPYINEPEYINGYIYANVWTTNFIVKINPKTGIVEARADMNALAYDARSKSPSAEAMNGIAYDKDKDKIYVTGKQWPNIYEVRFDH